ncbi:MAG: hypothetical protein HS103_04895 [Anaerolineales bacterium]|nr:hypothetical protein [Anaerolineales bacterium]
MAAVGAADEAVLKALSDPEADLTVFAHPPFTPPSLVYARSPPHRRQPVG